MSVTIRNRDSKISESDWKKLNKIWHKPLWRLSEKELNADYEFVYEFAKQDGLNCTCKICVLCEAILEQIGKNGKRQGVENG